MKKTSLYLCVIAVLATVFSSCLGDNESTTSASKTFTFIQEDPITGKLYAAIKIGYGLAYITGTGLTDVSAGDAALISYKVNLNNLGGGTTISQAEYISVNEVFPRPHKVVRNQPMDTLVNNSPFKSVIIDVPDQNMSFKNRWLFQFSADMKGDSQNFDVVFSYDKDSQKDKDGNALAENTVIVDVTLVKTGVPVEGATAKPKTKPVVVDFTSFRNEHTPSTIPDNGVLIYVWFRYIYENPTTKKAELYYLKSGVGLGYWKETEK